MNGGYMIATLLSAEYTNFTCSGCRFFYGHSIIVVVFRFCQQVDVLVAIGRPILDRLWHAVGLVPDDLTPQVPPITLQSHGHLGRYHHEVFGLEPFGPGIGWEK